jgi:type II secretory pathway pseudopilin PulG
MMEVLVGLAVIIIIISVITPPLVMSTAIRVRNYRTQQAMKLAQGEIDRVRLLVERGDLTRDELIKQLPPYMKGVSSFDVDSVQPPTSTTPAQNCPLSEVSGTTDVTTWCSVDLDGDTKWDMGIQSFRTLPPPEVVAVTKTSASDTIGQQVAFGMGVRVYTREALLSGKPASVVNPKAVSMNFSSGQSLSHPLAYIKTAIVRSDLSISSYSYCQLIKRNPSLVGSTAAGKSSTATCSN